MGAQSSKLVLPLDDKLMQIWSTTQLWIIFQEGKTVPIRTSSNLLEQAEKMTRQHTLSRAGRKDATTSLLQKAPLPLHHMNGGMGTRRKDAMSVRWLVANALLLPNEWGPAAWLGVKVSLGGWASHLHMHQCTPWALLVGRLNNYCPLPRLMALPRQPPARGSNHLAELVCLDHCITFKTFRDTTLKN